jgi:type II secretory pathway component PulC
MSRTAMETRGTAVPQPTEPEPAFSFSAAIAASALDVAAVGLPPPLQSKRANRGPGREVWVFRPLNAALVCLIAYFVWDVGLQLAGIREQLPDLAAKEEPQTTASFPIKADFGKPRQVEEYKVIWGRNLFGVSTASVLSSRPAQAAIEKIALASRDLGLRLIGTVVADDPRLNYAVMDIIATHDQGIFRERDRVGKAVIKSILRNTVIVETENGERRRLVVDEDLGRNPGSEQPSQVLPAGVAAAPAPPENSTGGDRTSLVTRDEVASSFSDIPRLIEESVITSPVHDENLHGFYLGRLRAADVLFRIGMRTGDVVKGVDGQEYGGPDDAEPFLRRLAQGGHLSVLIERRGEPRKLDVLIE